MSEQVRQMRCVYDKGAGCEDHRNGSARVQSSRRTDSVRESDPNAAFFYAKPDKPYDDYFCGCWGWN